MDPLSALGMASSVFALVGVVTKITHYLDTLSEKWHDAAFMILSLRTQVESFKGALEELHNWMVAEFQHTSNSDLFVQKLDLSLEGCSRLLCALEQKVKILSTHPQKPSKRDKTVLLWTESGIKDISDSLQCQANALMLLLQCRTLSQQGQLLSSESNRQVIRKMTDQTALMRQIQEEENTPDVPAERDTSSLSILFQHKDIVPVEDSLNSAIYAEHLTSLFGKTSLSSSPLSSQETLLPPGNGTVATAVEDISNIEGKGRNDYDQTTLTVTQEKTQTTSGRTPFNFAKMMPGGPQIGGNKKSTSTIPSFAKFRILVIGQAGVGKSTLCSKILGISEDSAGVSSRGIGTPIGKVWEETTFPGQNDNLILHDSGGFEAGSELAMQEIKKFVESRKKEPKMADQYCISCSGHRPYQQAEKYFFEGIDTGPIPVIVVFTQYDLRVREHFSDWIDSHDETLSMEQGRQVAAEKAFEDYDQHYKGALPTQIKNSTRFSICRVGFSKGSETKGDGHESTDSFGTTALIAATLNGLNSDRLRLIWMVAQRQRVDYLLKASVERCIDHFWTVQKYSKIPVPLLGVATIGSAYQSVIISLNHIWKIKTKPVGLLAMGLPVRGSLGFLEASLFVTSSELLLSSMALAYNMLGPLTGTLTAKIILEVIVGCALIFERLFWLQQGQGDQAKSITRQQVSDVLFRFSVSRQRQKMSDIIENSVKLSNCYSRTKAKDIVQQAVDAAKTEHGNHVEDTP
ncbi:hypothetical protein MMC27_001024 [Xylographa pallens]|nr:hypothetical protein [Xylographa pallens]